MVARARLGLETILAPIRYLTGRHTLFLVDQMFRYRVISPKNDMLRTADMIAGI